MRNAIPSKVIGIIMLLVGSGLLIFLALPMLGYDTGTRHFSPRAYLAPVVLIAFGLRRILGWRKPFRPR